MHQDTLADYGIPLLQLLDEQIARHPDSAELYFKRAEALQKLGNSGKARADAAEAIRKDSFRAAYYRLLAEIYFASEEFTRALQTLETGRQKLPDDVSLMLETAKYYYIIGEKQKSIRLLDSVLMKNISNPYAYFYKGMIFKEIGDTSRAISSFQTAIEQNPGYYEAYMQLGLLFSKKNDPVAIDYFSNALKIDSTSEEALYGMALFYQNQGNYKQAKQLYRKMIMQFPQGKRAFYNMGYIYFLEDSLDKAERNFDLALKVAPDYTEAYYMLGLCAERKNQTETARYYYRQSLNLKPDYQLALDGLQRVDK